MSSIDSVSAVSQSQTQVGVATATLKIANEQQQQAAQLVEDAVAGVAAAIEPGKGGRIDAHA